MMYCIACWVYCLYFLVGQIPVLYILFRYGYSGYQDGFTLLPNRHYTSFQERYRISYSRINTSVADPPLFWATPEVRGPGADSGSGQIGSAPRLHTLKFAIFSSYKVNYYRKSFLDYIYLYKMLLSHV